MEVGDLVRIHNTDPVCGHIFTTEDGKKSHVIGSSHYGRLLTKSNLVVCHVCATVAKDQAPDTQDLVEGDWVLSHIKNDNGEPLGIGFITDITGEPPVYMVKDYWHHPSELTKTKAPDAQETVNHPPHYNSGRIETIDFIEDQQLGFNLGNVIKYISRAGHKGKRRQDLEKAAFYLARELQLIGKEEEA